MVICDRPVSEVVPVEWARMEGRTVVQWDKDDCAAAGLVKFDLLGLGMLTALHLMIDLVAEHHGRKVELHELAAHRPRGLRDARRAPTRWGCSRWSPGRRWPPCPGSSRASSTTWSSRSR